MSAKPLGKALLISVLLTVGLAGCSSRIDPSIKTATFTPRPALVGSALGAEGQATSVTPPAYRLGPLDELKVTVFHEPDLSVEDMPVDLGGTISMPLIGQMQAVGLTAGELGASIAQKLNARYLRDAQVAVSVTKPVNYNVTVDGEVKKPGVYQIPGRLTLLQAISLGEGLTEFARQDEVIVLRTINGQRYVARFNLDEIRAARSSDIKIEQSDVVIVGFSRASRLLRDVITSLPGLASVFIALRQ